MTNEILINVTFDEIRVGVLEAGQLVELYIERKKNASLVGNIYKGRVVKVLPGMQSAFVDIGLQRAAFLYVSDVKTDIEDYSFFLEDDEEAEELSIPKGKTDLPIEELLQEGQEVLVQVSKDPIGSKGARVTTYVTLPGRYLVLMPGLEHVGVSRRITEVEKRQALREVVEAMKPKGFGLIVRTAAEDASQEELRADLEFLVNLWQNISEKKQKVTAPALLYSDFDLVLRSARDLLSPEVERVVLDSKSEYRRLKEFVTTYFPKLADKIELYEGQEGLFDAFGVHLDISRALERRVWLKSGGYIVIDQTEAMTVIDVNTGKYVGKENLQETILKTNLEAVKEIAYQIRLRNLGGIIIIDFIDMDSEEDRQKVLTALKEAMKKDKAKATIFDISELGLVQMTRKRVRESLGRMLCEPCPYCEGRGMILSARTICFEIFRKIERLTAPKGRKVVVTVHPHVAEILTDEERQSLEDLERTKGYEIVVRGDQAFHQEHYSITVL